MVWYGMVWYGMVWYGMVWYGVIWYGMVIIICSFIAKSVVFYNVIISYPAAAGDICSNL